MTAETALLTPERGLRLTIRFLAMPTMTTRTRRVARVNKLDLHTHPCCFVRDGGAKLIEGPRVPFIAVLSSNHCPVPDTCEVFKGKCLARYDGFVYQGLCDAVIDISLETLFAPAHLLEAAFSGTGPNALQDLAALVIAHPDRVYFGTRKGFTHAIGCQIDYPKINAKRLIRLSQFGCLLALGDIQIVGTASPHKVSTANLPKRVSQHRMLTMAQDHTASDTSLQGIERDTIKTQKTVRARVVADTPTRPKLRTGLALLGVRGLNRLHRFSTRTTGQLRTKPETGTRLTIDAVMGRVGVRNPFIPTHGRNPRGGSVKCLLRLLQCGFVSVYVKLDTNCSYERLVHKGSLPQRVRARQA